MGSIRKVEMASIQKFRTKWKAFVRKKKITVIKTFLKKSDARKWADKIEAQILVKSSLIHFEAIYQHPQ